MTYSITRVLHQWMCKRRIIKVVAQAMGKSDITLAAELRPSSRQAKLGADELVPLFQAVRQVGYGRELDGILYHFMRALQGSELAIRTDPNMVSHVLSLVTSLGTLSACASNIATSTDEAELERLGLKLRTEVLPVVLRMEALVYSRLDSIRGHAGKMAKTRATATPPPDLSPDPVTT